MSLDPSNLRREYERAQLLESQVSPDPFKQFSAWFAEAKAAGIFEVNAMTLATAGASGAPSARIVLLKDVRDGAFTFFTSYISRKARELAENPRASLLFYWDVLERQVRIEGDVSRTPPDVNEKYFHNRPRKSQIGAIASRQSEPIASREELEKLGADAEIRYAGGEVPLPDFWGGYKVTASVIEFWQGRGGRLHDRLLYTRQPDGAWKITRLQP